MNKKSIKKCKHKYKCGCEKYLTTPPSCPPSEPCEDYQPCSYYTDAQCVIYTGEDLICKEEVIIEKGELLSKSLEKLVDKLCESPDSFDQDFYVNIFPQEGLEIGGCLNTLESSVTGISGTFEYLWEVVSNKRYKVDITSDPTLTSVDLERNLISVQNSVCEFSTLIRLRVTHVESGKVRDAYYELFTDCCG